MDIQTYLERIQYRGSLAPTLNTLQALQQAHMRTVPFENLSIHYRQPIILDQDWLFRKIVDCRRGGFCYELNGLFAGLLQELGFNVTMLSARVFTREGLVGPEFDHMALLVDLDGPFLVDVGFGDSFQLPLHVNTREEQLQGSMAYQIEPHGDAYTVSQRSTSDQPSCMKAQYQFTLNAQALSSFSKMCAYHQTSPASHFTQKRICSRATADGRITLSDMQLIVTKNNTQEKSLLGSEQEYLQALKSYFSITL